MAIIGLLLAISLLHSAGLALAATPEQDVAGANTSVQHALTAARAGDLTTAKQAYDQYENTWFEIEDGVRTASHDAYVAIEKAMSRVTVAFESAPPTAVQVASALEDLDREQDAFIEGQPSHASAPPTISSAQPTLSGLIDALGDARDAIARNEFATASVLINTFQNEWPAVEGEVKTRSPEDYRQTEIDLGMVQTLVGQSSPQAGAIVDRMANRLQAYGQPQRYGIFDAAIILLREGLEALLVIVALSAFLKKAGNRAGQGWVWAGAAGGLLLSVVVGLAIQAFFGAIINPGNREIMEGTIGLVAAAMLVYVSYWLHSKASLGGWQSYISTRTSQAIAGGRLLGLAVLAFLAVFREGAETALFYLGMASNISTSDLVIGLGLGFAGLAVLGFLVIVVGVRIPMRPFFTVASLLVFYLCFKFVGMGIHALQVAGVIPSGSASYLPSFDSIGLYPTWPTTAAQLLLLGAGLWVVLGNRLARSWRLAARALVSAILVLCTACSSSTPTVSPATPTAPTAAADALVPARPVVTSGRHEVALVAGPRGRLEDTVNALQRNNIGGARTAFEAYDAEWNGIEVYVNFRSRALYGEIESHYQVDITAALQGSQPNATEIIAQLQQMIAKYDEAITLSDTGPPLSPLFDDVAAVRIIRAPLRSVSPALKVGDTAKASARFATFKTRWPEVRGLMSARSDQAVAETQSALDDADRAMSAPIVNPAQAVPLVDALLDRYNIGLNLLTAAARSAD